MDSTYLTEMTRAMELISRQQGSVFLCQSLYQASVIRQTCASVAPASWIELPVFEDTQMGMAIGLSLSGWLPVSIYPRFEFLLLALNQLVNHLDKFPEISEYRPRVIVRVLVGHSRPLDSGPQMTNDYTAGIQALLKNVTVEVLDTAAAIYPAYERAVQRLGSTVLVEYSSAY